MKILITEQFNKSISKLDDAEKQQIFSVFTRLEVMSKKEIFDSHMLIKIATFEEKIYIIKSKDVRIFCTFESEGNREDMIFLDVLRKNSNNLKIPANLTSR